MEIFIGAVNCKAATVGDCYNALYYKKLAGLGKIAGLLIFPKVYTLSQKIMKSYVLLKRKFT